MCSSGARAIWKKVLFFSDDPVAMAGKWAALGCQRLHLVDLDGAFEGEPINADVIEEISASFPKLAYPDRRRYPEY